MKMETKQIVQPNMLEIRRALPFYIQAGKLTEVRAIDLKGNPIGGGFSSDPEELAALIFETSSNLNTQAVWVTINEISSRPANGRTKKENISAYKAINF